MAKDKKADGVTEVRAVASLKPHPKNPRTHPDSQVAGLAGAFEEFGVLSVPVVDDRGTILAGHARVDAAKKAGIKDLTVFVVRGWTDEKKMRFMLSDNRWQELAGYNDAVLRENIAALQLAGDDLAAIGYDAAALAELFAIPNPGNADPEDTPERPKKPVVRKGDLWLLGAHRLLCGDATKAKDVETSLGGAKPNLLVTDPPYGVDYDPDWRNRADRANGKPYGASAIGLTKNDTRVDWTDAWKLFSGNVAYCWHAVRHASAVQCSFETAGFELRAQIIWAKTRLIISRGHYHMQHEPCWYFVRGGENGHWCGDRKQTTLWTIEHQKSETGHSAQKPVECMKRPIENNSRKGESIYDPFLGSGTTVIACEMTGRKCIGIEIDPGYVQVAIERWQKFSGKKATLDGHTLEQVATARRTGRPKATIAGRAPKREKGGLVAAPSENRASGPR